MMLNQFALSAADTFGLKPNLRYRMERDPDRHGRACAATTGRTHLLADDELVGDQRSQQGCDAVRFVLTRISRMSEVLGDQKCRFW